jgi:hypothetical protein
MKLNLLSTTLLSAGVALAAPAVDAQKANQLAAYQNGQLSETYLQSQMNDMVNLKDSADCKPIIIIFARGTFEPPPAPGLLVGYWFTQDVQKKYPGKVAVQSVTYKAGIGGYLSGGDADGAKTMAKMVEDTVKSCPKSRIVMGGYSQGGQVVHKATAQMSANAAKHVKAIVIFGDPDAGKKMKGIDPKEVDTMCASSDPICKGLPIPLGTHLTYGAAHHTEEAAQWLKDYLGPDMNQANASAKKGLTNDTPAKKGGKAPSFSMPKGGKSPFSFPAPGATGKKGGKSPFQMPKPPAPTDTGDDSTPDASTPDDSTPSSDDTGSSDSSPPADAPAADSSASDSTPAATDSTTPAPADAAPASDNSAPAADSAPAPAPSADAAPAPAAAPPAPVPASTDAPTADTAAPAAGDDMSGMSGM